MKGASWVSRNIFDINFLAFSDGQVTIVDRIVDNPMDYLSKFILAKEEIQESWFDSFDMVDAIPLEFCGNFLGKP